MRRLNPSYLHLFNSTYAFSSFLDLIENVYNGLFDICNSLASLKQEHSSLTISGIINYNSHLGAQIIIKNAKFGEHNSACSLFDSIRGDKPYSFLWNTMIRAYANGGCHVEVLELYPLMRPNNLIRCYLDSWANKTPACASKSLVLEGKVAHEDVDAALVTMDLVSWTAMITAYEQAEQPDKALLLFQYMQLHGVLSDSVTIVIHSYAICNGYLKYVSVGNAIIAMYAKCGNVSLPRLVFDLMEERHVISWNSIILGYSQNGQASEALFLSEVMLDSEAFTNPVTKIKIDANICNALMDMYVKCGDLDTATRLFNDIPPTERNITSWNVLISGYDMHGYGKEALNLFSQMQQTGIKPDHITFTSLLSACGHAGLIDEGRKCFAEMKKHSESLRVKHYACMVDILGRAGLLNQAFDMGALLLACRIHGDTELTELATRSLYKIENSAFSVVELVNPYWQEVYGKVESLAAEIKMVGYVPNLSCVLHDVDDEDKEHILNYHSEKLAMAFGIMKIDPEMSVQVTNNLRICNDCYSAFKFVSYVYGRKIVVRDAYRFHHFQDGTCSCNDYW
ncbi:hypothetical protein V6Z11_A07G053900 [Gossypium hirsutum]